MEPSSDRKAIGFLPAANTDLAFPAISESLTAGSLLLAAAVFAIASLPYLLWRHRKSSR